VRRVDAALARPVARLAALQAGRERAKQLRLVPQPAVVATEATEQLVQRRRVAARTAARAAQLAQHQAVQRVRRLRRRHGGLLPAG
jgi:hypothetical protein